MKLLLSLCMLLFVNEVFGQQADRWRGLVIDESTADKAIEILGQPKSDKMDKMFILNSKWVTKNTNKMRVMQFEKIEGFSKVKLGFDANSKLVVIHLEPKKITAQAFVASYEGVSFRFANEVMTAAELTEPRNSLEKPYNPDVWYVVVGATKNVFVFGGIANVGGHVMGTLFGGNKQAGRSMPGEVKQIQLISRTLENKDGTNLLK